MSRNTKIALGIVGGVLVLCICAGGLTLLVVREGGKALSKSLATDPAEVAAIGDEIANYDVPPGYVEQMGMRILGMDYVIIAQADSGSAAMIMLMQFSSASNLSREQMELQMQQSLETQYGAQGYTFQKVGEDTVTIRGDEVILTIREDSNAGFRQVTGVFQGNNGPTVLMIQGPISGWDQEAFDGFMSSIR